MAFSLRKIELVPILSCPCTLALPVTARVVVVALPSEVSPPAESDVAETEPVKADPVIEAFEIATPAS